jgi:hypothetical protein
MRERPRSDHAGGEIVLTGVGSEDPLNRTEQESSAALRAAIRASSSQ